MGRPSLRRHEALQFLVPMLHDDEHGPRVRSGRFDHKEPFAIERHVVVAARRARIVVASLEQFRRRAGVPRRAGRLHRHVQECTVGTDIEQFLAVPCPEWSRPARRRDWRLAAADVRKWPDVDFERARTVGVVRNPPAVGRDDPVELLKLRLQQRSHPSCPAQRELHEVVCHRRCLFVEKDGGPVGCDRRGKLVVAARGQPLGVAAVSRLPPEIEDGAAAVRGEDNPLAVRGPYGKPIQAGVECQARERRPRQVRDPDVVLLIAAPDGDACPVG